MIRRYRNGDRDLRELEHAYQSDPSDLNVYISILAARRRSGIPVNQGVPPAAGDVEAYAKLLEAMLETKIVTRPRVAMAARLGHEAARLAAPEWVVYRKARSIHSQTRLAIEEMDDKREMVSFSCDCSERVLTIFERQYHGDMRPRMAINAARKWILDATHSNSVSATAAAVARAGASDAVTMSSIVEMERPESAAATAAAGAAMYTAAAAIASGTATATAVISVCSYALSAVRLLASHGGRGVEHIRTISDAERSWQVARLCQYFLGEVTRIRPTE